MYILGIREPICKREKNIARFQRQFLDGIRDSGKCAEYQFFGPRQNSQFMLPDFTNRLSLREERRGEVLCD